MIYQKPYLIAELGCNHAGSVEKAKEMIKAAKSAGADCAKFQKRSPKELLTVEQYVAPHPNPVHAFGKTYGEHREALELSVDDHVELLKCCRENAIEYSTSVWDLISAREIVEKVNPSFLKVPSACNNNIPLLMFLINDYKGKIHVSTGMTTGEEHLAMYSILPRDRTVIYHCTSGYPVPSAKLYLSEIPMYFSWWNEVGFSGHHVGTAEDIAAYALGARYIERHFTLDKTSKGTDHQASLIPNEFWMLKKNLNDVFEALKERPEKMDAIEVEQRQKLKYRAK